MIALNDINRSDKNGPEIRAIGSNTIKILSDCFIKKFI